MFFGHHPQFRERYRGEVWMYHRIRVPADALICKYPNIGDADVPGGLAAVTGFLNGLRGVRLQDMVGRIRERLRSEAVVRNHPLIQKISALTLLTSAGIYQLPQPLMLEPSSNTVTVIEGNHRYLALLLLGETRVQGFDWSRIAEVR